MSGPQAPARDWADLQRTPVPGVSLLRAHFVEHAFERHSHETFSIGLTYGGGQSFRCRGTVNTSHRGNIIAFNPDEAHDGHAEDELGFAYAMLYLPAGVVDEWLGASGAAGGGIHFRRPLLEDRACATALAQAIDAIRCPGEDLRAATLIQAAVTQLAERHGHGRPAACRERASAGWLRRVHEHMAAHHASNLSVQALADVAGVSRVHLTRAFVAVHGVPPHVHLNALRLRAAQRLLMQGCSLADAAAAAGFVDQSHFTRRFRGSLGVTPSHWARAMRPPSGHGQRRA